jgi:glycopeptide antibiotics resistance protein
VSARAGSWTPQRQLRLARLACIVVVLLATLTNLDFSPDLGAAAGRLARAVSFSLSWRDAIDGIRNLALFAGLGVVWVVTSPSGRVGEDVQRVTLIGAALSLTVEAVQLFSPVRNASLVDVATNTGGALAGAVAVALLIAAVRGARGGRSYVGVPTFLLAGGYALAVACEAMTPLFRGEPIPDVGGGPLDHLGAALQLARPLSLGRIPLFDVILFVPAGFLLVMLLAERGLGSGRAWPRVALAGVAASFAIEWAHGLVGLAISWEAAATHAVALAAGAWAAHRWLPAFTRSLRGASRARAMLAAYTNLLIFWGWRPLLPETDGSLIAAQLTVERFIPLRSLAERVDLFSAGHVVEQGALWLPLGALVAVWPLRLRGRWSQLWPAFWLALALEVGHIVIVDRFFDVTNALIAVAGAAVGWIVVRRSGFAPYGEALAGLR